MKKVQQRMAEAEKRMIEDELITDDLLLVGSAEFEGRDELGGGGDAPFMRGGGRGRGTHMYSQAFEMFAIIINVHIRSGKMIVLYLLIIASQMVQE